MADTIQTKRCSKCKEIKSVLEFAPRNDRPSGLQSHCKQCQKEYRHIPEVAENIRIKCNIRRRTPKYRKQRRKNQKSAKYKVWLQEYRDKNREHLNAIQRKRNKIRTQNGKNKKRARRYARKNPEKVRCFWAMKYAIKSGKLKKAKNYKCFYCGKKAHHYHHCHGYDTQHRLDVIPVCAKCHKSVHRAIVLRT